MMKNVYEYIKDDENRQYCLAGFDWTVGSKILPMVNVKQQIWKHAVVGYPEQKELIPETLRSISTARKNIILLNKIMIRKEIFAYHHLKILHFLS